MWGDFVIRAVNSLGVEWWRKARANMAALQYRRVSESGDQAKALWSFTEVVRNLPNERERYRYFLWVYLNVVPESTRRHRGYFGLNGRGFGEDAFHGMWWKLLEEFKPTCAVEIGVFRGQTISLWSLQARQLNQTMDVWGISPLSNVGDAVSNYLALDYESDIEVNFQEFDLGAPNLVQARSQEQLAKDFMATRMWDLVYIDGSHDFEDVVNDINLVRACTEPGAVLVMDDASLYSNYRPYLFAFAGHPGPSLAASSPEIMKDFIEIGSCGHNRVFQRT